MSRAPMQQDRRSRKLVKRAFQTRVIMVVASLTCASVIIQAFTLNRAMVSLTRKVPEIDTLLWREWPSILRNNLLLTFVLTTALVVIVGLHLTFRIAGPLRCFENYLNRLIRGEADRPCALRHGDELTDFCDLLNEATASLRIDPPDDEENEEGPRPAAESSSTEMASSDASSVDDARGPIPSVVRPTGATVDSSSQVDE